jgi:hypothetical protein
MADNYAKFNKNPQTDQKVIDLTQAMDTKCQKFLLRKYKGYGRKQSWSAFKNLLGNLICESKFETQLPCIKQGL